MLSFFIFFYKKKPCKLFLNFGHLSSCEPELAEENKLEFSQNHAAWL